MSPCAPLGGRDEVKLPKGSKIDKQINAADRERQNYTRIWDLCSLFLQGKQHVRWDKNLSNYISQERTGGNRRSRVTINLILNMYRNLLARYSVAYPSTTVMPSSPSNEDITKAQACETFLKYYWHTADMPTVISSLLEWCLLNGTSAFHTFYDPSDKKIHTRAVSTYDLLFEPGASSVSEARWVVVRQTVHKEDLIAAYPDKKELIEKSGRKPDASFKSLLRRSSGHTQTEPEDRVEIYEVYFSDRTMGILLGSEWLFADEWATPTSPISVVHYTRIPGRIWGLGVIEPLVELQTMYNRGRSQVIENAELMGNPKWLIPKSSGVAKDALRDSRPGEKVTYNANSGPPPTQVSAAPLPGYILDNIRQLSAEMLDVAGVHSTSLGKRAIGIESGAAIDSLTDRDSQQLQVTQGNVETAIREVAKCVLEMAKVYYDEDKMMRILDNTGKIVYKQLQNTDISEDPEIYIEAGTLFRDEKHDRDQRVLEMVKLGLMEKDEALRELDYRTGNARITKRMAGFSHAGDMLTAVREGRLIEVMPTDDLEAFAQVFGDFMQEAEYYELEPDTQEYIRDVLVAVATFGKEEEDFARAEMERTVFPRVEGDPKAMAEGAGMLGSPMAGAQMAEAAGVMAQRRSLMDGEPNPEQGIGRTRMGGGG
jgi:hypothetical protein